MSRIHTLIESQSLRSNVRSMGTRGLLVFRLPSYAWPIRAMVHSSMSDPLGQEHRTLKGNLRMKVIMTSAGHGRSQRAVMTAPSSIASHGGTHLDKTGFLHHCTGVFGRLSVFMSRLVWSYNSTTKENVGDCLRLACVRIIRAVACFYFSS